jgi:cell division protein FtsW
MQLVEMGIMLNISQHRYYPEEPEPTVPAPEPDEPDYDEPKNA